MAGRESKYSITRSAEWRWRHEDDRPRITEHALEQWDERTPRDSVSPETAWLASAEAVHLDADIFEDRRGRSPDELHYYHNDGGDDGDDYDVVFLVIDQAEYAILTVYTLGMVAKVTHRAVADYFRGLRPEVGR